MSTIKQSKFKAPLLHVLKEETPQYMNHDQLFKKLIEVFFEEFLEAFFPEIHEQIDFERITFLSEELFPGGSYDGNKRVVDLVVEVKWKETDMLIAIHIEPQSYVQTNFNVRMFKYFSLLYNKIKKPIIPIAIFGYEESWEKSKFSMQFSDLEILRFNYLTLHLRKQNWRNFIMKNNPVAAALLSKMGYNKDERVQVKLEFFKTLARLKLDREKTNLLLGFFESYLKLTEEEEATFVMEAKKLENAEEILEIPISYEERGKAIGRKEGREEEKRKVALKLLAEGIDIKLIRKATELTLEEIKLLQKQL